MKCSRYTLFLLLFFFIQCKKKGDSTNNNTQNNTPVCYLSAQTIQSPDGILTIQDDTAYLSPNSTYYCEYVHNDTLGVGIDFSGSDKPDPGKYVIVSDFSQISGAEGRAYFQFYRGSQTFVAQSGEISIAANGQLEACKLKSKVFGGDLIEISLKTQLK
ncbi:MAG: hypothetical protein KBF25_09410 [Chitinophagaceae bacterium]|jgi:hypothetical protein|nr:hypothetical protein [Bacteroidota bacterium]MBP9933903.1 hypothetical protein [Chitinophagaceae bacterium]